MKMKLNAERLATFAACNLPYTMARELRDHSSKMNAIIHAMAAGIVQEVETAQGEAEANERGPVWSTPRHFVNDPFTEAVRAGFDDEPPHVRQRHRLFERAHRSFDVKDLDLFK